MTAARRVHTRPTVGAPKPWAFPEATSATLPNGLRVLLLDLPGQHVLSLRITVPAPVSHEAPGTEGSTLMMMRSLDEGTASHSADELAELTERHGIALAAGAGERGVHLGAEVTARHLPVALDLVTECLAEPTFPEPEVTRLVRHRVTDIAHDLADPGARASLELMRAYFDTRDRPHTPLGGTPDSVAALSPAVLQERHAVLGPRGGTVVLAGDLAGVTDPVDLLARTLGAWSGADESPGPPGPARRSAAAAGLVLVPRPGMAQTELALARPGPDRRTAHGWGTYQTLGMLLGGTPHARLDRVLREERGFTYGMRLGFRPRSVGGLCVVGGSVRSDATVPALGAVLDILDLPGAELSEREVREAADYLAMTAPGRYQSADAVADEVVSLVSDGLDLSTITRTMADLRALTPERAAAAWEEVRTGPGWSVVAVGDPRHTQGVAELGLGPVRTLEP